MNWFYTKVMSWLFGQAIANSDRVRVAIASALSAGFLLIISKCAFCSAILTPELADKLAIAIVTLGLKMMHSLDSRDIAAPDEVVPGEAMPEPPPLPQ